ncbi:hypothetical protein KUTeg_011920 [Tegillarca granosa]|uniref:Ribosomal protein L20 n=1 Tax=Tegillarca granosa TaxID=220873 RepID=A0ABQ9EY33_TEGGR|nr:hypothetical protein KUTeg_011920 [Tegillarca granosa]
MYSLVFAENRQKNTAKGISKSVIKKSLRHAKYRECLFRKKVKKSQTLHGLYRENWIMCLKLYNP